MSVNHYEKLPCRLHCAAAPFAQAGSRRLRFLHGRRTILPTKAMPKQPERLRQLDKLKAEFRLHCTRRKTANGFDAVFA